MQIVYNVTRHVVAVHLVLLLFIHPVTLQATENRPKHAQQREAEYQPLETELSETESGSSQEDRLRKEIKRKIKNIMNGKRSMVIFGALFCFVVASSAKLVNDLYWQDYMWSVIDLFPTTLSFLSLWSFASLFSDVTRAASRSA